MNVYLSTEKNFDNNGLGFLIDCLSANVVEELNGEYGLNITYPINSSLSNYLVVGNIIKTDVGDNNYQLFRISQIEKNFKTISIYARHIYYDLLDNFIEDSAPTNLACASAAKWLLDRAEIKTKFEVYSDAVGIHSARYVRRNPIECFMGNINNSLVNLYNVEIERDNYLIKFLKQRGNNKNVKLIIAKNIKDINVNIDISSLFTRIMPLGYDGLMLPEKYIDSSLINNYPTPKIGKYEFSNIKYDPEDEEAFHTLEEAYQALRDETNLLFVAGIDKPVINIKIDWLELSKTKEYYDKYNFLEKVSLGDTITAEILGLNFETRVIKTTYNVLTKQIDKFEIGTFKPTFQNTVNTIVKNVEDINPSTILEQAKDNATKLLTSAMGGYVYKTHNELFIMDTDNPNTATKVWRWNLNGLGYSENGINGPYEIAITQDGSINADFITSGKINTNLIEGYEQLILTVTELNRQYEQDMTIDKKVEGYPIVVEDAGAYNIEELKVYGNSEQDTRSGKNLLYNSNKGTTGWDWVYQTSLGGNATLESFENTGIHINISEPPAGWQYTRLLIREEDILKLKPNTKYTLSFDYKTNTSHSSVTIKISWSNQTNILTDVVKTSIIHDNEWHKSTTILTTNDLTNLKNNQMLYIQGIDTIGDFYIKNIQLEEGSNATDYEPYGAMPSPEFPSEVRNVEPVENLFDFNTINSLVLGTVTNDVITTNDGSTSSPHFNLNFKIPTIHIKKGETLYFSADIKLNGNSTGRFNTMRQLTGSNSVPTNLLNPTMSQEYQRYLTSVYYNEDYDLNTILIQLYQLVGTASIKNVMISKTNNSYVPYGNWLKGKITGKNLFNNKFRQGSESSKTASTKLFSANNIYLEPGTYAIKTNISNIYHYAILISNLAYPCAHTPNVTYDSGWKNENYVFSITTGGYFGIAIEKTTSPYNLTPNDISQYYFMLKQSDTATEYEPYKEKEFLYNMNKYDEEGNVVDYYELSKINETKDDLNFISGILNKKIGRIVLTGDENWEYREIVDGTERKYFRCPTYQYTQGLPKIIDAYHNNCCCTHYKIITTNWTNFLNDTTKNQIFPLQHDGYKICIRSLNCSSADEFKNYLKDQYNAGTPVTIYYELETPEQYQLEPINIELFKGYNRITLEDKYGIVEEAEMTYLTNSKLNGQYATKAELKLTSDSITSEVNKKVSTDNFNSTVSDLNSKIKQTADSIKSEVSATYSTKTEVEEAVSNIEIGGRNLLLGTATATGDVADGTGTLVDTNLFDGIKGIKTHTAWNERYMNLKNIADRKGFEVGDKLIASVYIKADQNVTGNLWLERATRTGNVAETTIKNAQITTEWKQYSFPFIADEGSLSRTNTRIEFDTATEDNYIYWAGWKLEKGTKSSDWTPAPEDTDSKIDTAKNDAISSANSSTDDKLKSYSTTTEMNNTITQKITDSENSITQNVNKQITDISGKVTDIEGKVELKIDEKDLFSKFNVNVGQVKITSDNFKLDEEGNIEFNKGTARDISISNGNINITDEGKDKLAHIELNSTGEYKSKLELNSYATSRVTTFGRNTYKTEDSAYDGIRQYIGDENSNWSTNSNLRAQGLFVHSSYSELKGTVSGVTPNSIYVSNVETDNATKMTPDYISITKTPTSPNHVVRLQDIVKSGQNGKCFATSGNLNNLTDTGFYHVNSPTNSPYEGDDTNGFVITMNYNDTYIAQIFIADSANSLFIRIKTSRGWNNWINH